MKNKSFGVLCVLLAVYSMNLGAQNQITASTTTTIPAAVPSATSSASPLSTGYDTIKLGMAYQAVYDALLNSPSLDYRGTPDVSLSPGRDEKIIEARGGRYIKRGIFQFRNDKLFTIQLEFNSDALDYYGLYSNFIARYGDANSLSPEEAMWENATVRLVLGKPLSLTYIDRVVMEELQKEAGIKEAIQESARADFINKL